MKDKTKPKPLKKIRFGAISATVWLDTYTDSKGQSFKTEGVVVDRAYKDRKGEWQHTATLRKDDLLKAALALQKTFEFLAAPEGDENTEDRMEVEDEEVR